MRAAWVVWGLGISRVFDDGKWFGLFWFLPKYRRQIADAAAPECVEAENAVSVSETTGWQGGFLEKGF